MKVLFGIIR